MRWLPPLAIPVQGRSQRDLLLPVEIQEMDLRARTDCDDSLPLQLLQEHLPDGSVYRWAAKLGGANLSDAMLGWIVLLVRLTIRAII